MADQKQEKPAFLFNLGDRVKIHHSRGMQGRVVELRALFAPGGVQVYRVVVGRKPLRRYIELREDQLELAPSKS